MLQSQKDKGLQHVAKICTGAEKNLSMIDQEMGVPFSQLWRPTGYKLWIIDVLLKSCGLLINVLILFVRLLLYCDRYCKSSVGLQTGHKRTCIAIYDNVTILGDQGRIKRSQGPGQIRVRCP